MELKLLALLFVSAMLLGCTAANLSATPNASNTTWNHSATPSPNESANTTNFTVTPTPLNNTALNMTPCTNGNTILSCPCTINNVTQNYTLASDLTSNGSCIKFEWNATSTLDCNGHAITGSDTGIGIDIQGNVVSVFNCSISNFETGIRAWDNSIYGGEISNNNITNNTGYGISGNKITTLQHNIITHNGEGAALSLYNTTITENIISNNTGDGLHLGGTYLKVYSNIITSNNGSGLVINSASANMVVNNTLNSNEGYGLNVQPNLGQGSSRLDSMSKLNVSGNEICNNEGLNGERDGRWAQGTVAVQAEAYCESGDYWRTIGTNNTCINSNQSFCIFSCASNCSG